MQSSAGSAAAGWLCQPPGRLSSEPRPNPAFGAMQSSAGSAAAGWLCQPPGRLSPGPYLVNPLQRTIVRASMVSSRLDTPICSIMSLICEKTRSTKALEGWTRTTSRSARGQYLKKVALDTGLPPLPDPARSLYRVGLPLFCVDHPCCSSSSGLHHIILVVALVVALVVVVIVVVTLVVVALVVRSSSSSSSRGCRGRLVCLAFELTRQRRVIFGSTRDRAEVERHASLPKELRQLLLQTSEELRCELEELELGQVVNEQLGSLLAHLLR